MTRLRSGSWPDVIELTKEAKVDFDFNMPMGEAEPYFKKRNRVWEILSEVPLGVEYASLALARTVEEYDGPTLWVMGWSAPGQPYQVLTRMNEDALQWSETDGGERLWATPAGNVLGYRSLLVRDLEGMGTLFSMVDGEVRVAFYLFDLAGFADLDLDGEQEAVCRAAEGPYIIYDREPGGYFCYTLIEPQGLETEPETFFMFDEEERAFGFGLWVTTRPWLLEEAPIYDRLLGGVLQRRGSSRDHRAQAGTVDGTVAFFYAYDPDQVPGWRRDGTPLPTARQQGAVLLRELEALTGYRPERCYLYGGGGAQYVSLEPDWEHRSFFAVNYATDLCGVERAISTLDLNWRGDWAPWSPLEKDGVELPADWAGLSREERAVWWYERGVYFYHGPAVSAGPSQYEGVVKCALEDGSFLEITLDDEGYLRAIVGPYPEGTVH